MQMTSMNDQETHVSWCMNLKTVEWLSNIFILHLKLISIVKSRSASITVGNMTKYTIFINFGQKYTKNELNDPLVVAMVI